MARPKEEESIVIGIRFKPSQLEIIRQVAEATGVGISTFIRSAALKAAKKAA